jgi:hypothetical protein
LALTARHNAQLAAQAEQFNAQLAEQAARHNAQLVAQATDAQGVRNRAPEKFSEFAPER